MITALAAAALVICSPSGARHTCVVDGDTVWIAGEKIRLAEIDAPEINGRCPAERALAVRSRARLAQLLAARPIRFVRVGEDRYGRTLATFGGVSDALIAEGLAQRWPRNKGWCK